MSSDFLCADNASACKATINVTCLQSTQTTLCAVVEDLCCYVRCWWCCRWVQCPGVTQEHTDHHHSTLISCWWELAQSTLHTEQPDHDKELSQVWNIIQSNSSQWSVVRSITRWLYQLINKSSLSPSWSRWVHHESCPNHEIFYWHFVKYACRSWLISDVDICVLPKCKAQLLIDMVRWWGESER